MKCRTLLISLVVFVVFAFSACSDDQPTYNMDDAELSSITEVYDQYTGFSTDFKRSNYYGNTDVITKQRYFPIDAVEIVVRPFKIGGKTCVLVIDLSDRG